jgi:hypothetical protein
MQGWRHFHCKECECSWREACRDAASPSGSDCPQCMGHTRPVGFVLDPRLAVDRFGNLLAEQIELDKR